MQITKFGHCCLLVEEQGVRILIDPGNLSNAQNDVLNIDIVLITHEHADHYHIDSLRIILKNNPYVKVITNHAVGKLLEKEGIAYRVLEHGGQCDGDGVTIEGYGERHEEIYKEFGLVQNTGYMIAGKFFYPGDAFYNPGRNVEILALPVAGPWCRIKNSIEYALAVKPKICFPVHDGLLKNPWIAHRAPATFLPEAGVAFRVLEVGKCEIL